MNFFWGGGTLHSPLPAPHHLGVSRRPPFWNPKYATVLNNYGFCADFCSVSSHGRTDITRDLLVDLQYQSDVIDSWAETKDEDKESHSIRYCKQKRNSGIKSNVHYDDIHNRENARTFIQWTKYENYPNDATKTVSVQEALPVYIRRKNSVVWSGTLHAHHRRTDIIFNSHHSS